MPRIAEFIKDLLTEDLYGTEFTSKLPERLQQLNAAQLTGMHNHLKKTRESSVFKPWKNANDFLMNQMKDILESRIKEAEILDRKKEDAFLKKKNKGRMQELKEAEAERVMDLISEAARKRAEKEIDENEKARQAAEKLEIMKKVFAAEENLEKVWKRAVAGFLVALALVIGINVAINNPIFIGVGVVLAILIPSYVTYRAWKATQIQPTVTPAEVLEELIEKREEELEQEAILLMKQKEREFKLREKKEAIERRQRREERKAKEAADAAFLTEMRLKELEMAKKGASLLGVAVEIDVPVQPEPQGPALSNPVVANVKKKPQPKGVSVSGKNGSEVAIENGKDENEANEKMTGNKNDDEEGEEAEPILVRTLRNGKERSSHVYSKLYRSDKPIVHSPLKMEGVKEIDGEGEGGDPATNELEEVKSNASSKEESVDAVLFEFSVQQIAMYDDGIAELQNLDNGGDADPDKQSSIRFMATLAVSPDGYVYSTDALNYELSYDNDEAENEEKEEEDMKEESKEEGGEDGAALEAQDDENNKRNTTSIKFKPMKRSINNELEQPQHESLPQWVYARGAEIPQIVTPEEARSILKAMYQNFNPGMLEKMDGILEKYNGKERELCGSLRKKYGPLPAPVVEMKPIVPPPASLPVWLNANGMGIIPEVVTVEEAETIINLYYKTFNPDKLKDIPFLLNKYQGKERILVGSLRKKYGNLPESVFESSSPSSQKKKKKHTRNKDGDKEESGKDKGFMKGSVQWIFSTPKLLTEEAMAEILKTAGGGEPQQEQGRGGDQTEENAKGETGDNHVITILDQHATDNQENKQNLESNDTVEQNGEFDVKRDTIQLKRNQNITVSILEDHTGSIFNGNGADDATSIVTISTKDFTLPPDGLGPEKSLTSISDSLVNATNTPIASITLTAEEMASMPTDDYGCISIDRKCSITRDDGTEFAFFIILVVQKKRK